MSFYYKLIRINGFKTDAPYTQCIFDARSVEIWSDLQEKCYRFFTAMMAIVAHNFRIVIHETVLAVGSRLVVSEKKMTRLNMHISIFKMFMLCHILS